MLILIKPSDFAMSLEHFSHEHPLILKVEFDARGHDEIVCYGCRNPIIRGSAVYTSSSDNFYLHKTCAELPRIIQHPMHEQHPLTLHARPTYKTFRCGCDVCRRDWQGFTYNCISCGFDSCVTCAEDRVFRHKGHKQHALTFLTRNAKFMCDACGTEATDLSYACSSCDFWMHKSCASSPATVEPDFHHHPLFLKFSFPNIHRTFPQFCGICKNRVYESYWLYYCSKCTYFVHIKCVASSETLPSGEKGDHIEVERQTDVDETNLVQFPVRCKKSFTDLIIDQFAKGINHLEEGEAAAAAPVPQTINHWSHRDHPLILLEELQSSEDDEMLLLCNGCVQPVSTAQPYYGCIGCNFFLHGFCAELPIELPKGTHSCHPQHPLVIRMNEEKFLLVKCSACRLFTNGFFFMCEECDMRFDIGCCFLPNRIKHESHKHHPLVNCAPSMSGCSACGFRINSDFFKCEITTCSSHFQICKACALLPSIMRHRWDRHPISLIYPPFPHEGVIYCEICEEEVNPNYWLYHCHECDQSFHTDCLRPSHNVKLGDKLVVGIHPHPLTFVLKNSNGYCRPLLCCNCGQEYFDKFCFIFECANCDFLFCMICALLSK